MLVRYPVLLIVLSTLTAAQGFPSSAFVSRQPNESPANDLIGQNAPVPDFTIPTPVRAMAPDRALQVYQERTWRQREQMVACSSITLIHAELPDISQQGEFELRRQYSAPRTLQFTALHSTGDGLVKSNIIPRMLQSEQDRVQKGNAAQLEINTMNYKISYLRTTQTDGRLIHAYEVKPRVKRFGLFRGRIYVDAIEGRLVRAEGNMVKLASFFLKKAEFVQDYANFGKFTFPVHLHSEVRARFVGRAVVDIYERDYRAVSAARTDGPLAVSV